MNRSSTYQHLVRLLLVLLMVTFWGGHAYALLSGSGTAESPYIITNAEDGILVENGNVKKFAEAILYLIENPRRLQKMSDNARENVWRFNIEGIALKWRKLFDELVDES